MSDDERRARDAERARAKRAANPEAYRAARAEYRKRPGNREKDAASSRAWREANPEKVEAQHARERKGTGNLRGEASPNWKGDAAGYFAIHVWMRTQFGTSRVCDHCKSTSAKRYDWANIDHKYRRVREDWMRLCFSCHLRHDYAQGLRKPRPRVRT